MTEPQDSTQGRYVVHFATGQEVTRTASSWAALAEEYEGRGFQPGDFLIVPVDEPLTDEQVADVDFEQAAAAERQGPDPAFSDVYRWHAQLTEEREQRRQHDAHLAHARYLGADAALAAASWLEMSESDARSIIDGDGDPEVLDRYPEPNLSGEWADDPTPDAVASEVGECPDDCDGIHVSSGPSGHHFSPEQVDEIAIAWEEGRDGCWSDAVEAFACRVVGNIPMALAIEASNEAYVASLRTAAGL